MSVAEGEWWTADEAITWLVFGRPDVEIVRLPDILIETESGEKHWARAPENIKNTERLRTATDELIESFRSERVSCFGVRIGNQSEGFQLIGPESWLSALTIHRNTMAPDAEAPMEQYVAASRRPRYEDLRVKAAEVMSLRTPPGSAPATLQLAAGSVRRKPNGVDFAKSDEPLLFEMRKLIESGKATSPYNAGLAVADRAAGSGNAVSKAKRLQGRYSVAFSPEYD